MKAISTKFLSPTNHKGARITAFDLDGNRVTIAYSYQTNAHEEAAQALLRKMGWTGHIIEGATKTGSVFVFCPHCS